MAKQSKESVDFPSGEVAPERLWLFAAGAILVAAAPHFFLAFPFQFFKEGQTQAWLGMSVWAPSLLAAAALFVETSLRGQFARPQIAQTTRAAAAILVPMAVVAVLVHLHFRPPFFGYTLGWLQPVLIAIALYGFVQGLEALFWQGLLQHRVMRDSAPALRVGVLSVLNVAVWLPFARSTGLDEALSTYLLDFGLIALASAVLFELGLQTRYVMLSRALMGAGFAWAYHTVFFA
ncbi:MAG: hypothetical protein H0U74_09230 [Bradymonadaceae bacterium]|nr:hypothetical protein [Lujinxingiaceae bacterium]